MQWFKSKTVFVLILVFLGFTEGIFLFGLNLGLRALWKPFIQYNSLFGIVQFIQEIILFCLIFLCFGYLAIRMKGSFATNVGYEKKAGAITGVIAGVVYVIVTDYYFATTKLIGYQYFQKYLVPDDPFNLKFYVSF